MRRMEHRGDEPRENYLVVPDFHQTIVATRDEVRLITAGVVVHAVHTLLVAFESEIRLRRS